MTTDLQKWLRRGVWLRRTGYVLLSSQALTLYAAAESEVWPIVAIMAALMAMTGGLILMISKRLAEYGH